MVHPSRAIQSAAWVAIVSALAVVAPATAERSGPVFRADGWQADEYGRGEGYPASTAARSEQKKSLVGSYSRWDELVSKREITTGGKPAQLARTPREPTIRYVSDGLTRSLDDYLDSYPITGLLIARGDRILVERYQYDRRDSDRFQSQSMGGNVADSPCCRSHSIRTSPGSKRLIANHLDRAARRARAHPRHSATELGGQEGWGRLHRRSRH